MEILTCDDRLGASSEVRRKTAPLAADHFYSLVQKRYYDNNGFFAVVPQYIQVPRSPLSRTP